jgi:hypothetical protein
VIRREAGNIGSGETCDFCHLADSGWYGIGAEDLFE